MNTQTTPGTQGYPNPNDARTQSDFLMKQAYLRSKIESAAPAPAIAQTQEEHVKALRETLADKTNKTNRDTVKKIYEAPKGFGEQITIRGKDTQDPRAKNITVTFMFQKRGKETVLHVLYEGSDKTLKQMELSTEDGVDEKEMQRWMKTVQSIRSANALDPRKHGLLSAFAHRVFEEGKNPKKIVQYAMEQIQRAA